MMCKLTFILALILVSLTRSTKSREDKSLLFGTSDTAGKQGTCGDLIKHYPVESLKPVINLIQRYAMYCDSGEISRGDFMEKVEYYIKEEIDRLDLFDFEFDPKYGVNIEENIDSYSNFEECMDNGFIDQSCFVNIIESDFNNGNSSSNNLTRLAFRNSNKKNYNHRRTRFGRSFDFPTSRQFHSRLPVVRQRSEFNLNDYLDLTTYQPQVIKITLCDINFDKAATVLNWGIDSSKHQIVEILNDDGENRNYPLVLYNNCVMGMLGQYLGIALSCDGNILKIHQAGNNATVKTSYCPELRKIDNKGLFEEKLICMEVSALSEDVSDLMGYNRVCKEIEISATGYIQAAAQNIGSKIYVSGKRYKSMKPNVFYHLTHSHWGIMYSNRQDDPGNFFDGIIDIYTNSEHKLNMAMRESTFWLGISIGILSLILIMIVALHAKEITHLFNFNRDVYENLTTGKDIDPKNIP